MFTGSYSVMKMLGWTVRWVTILWEAWKKSPSLSVSDLSFSRDGPRLSAGPKLYSALFSSQLMWGSPAGHTTLHGSTLTTTLEMILQVENSIWHAFDYLSVETGRLTASKSKLKVRAMLELKRRNKNLIEGADSQLGPHLGREGHRARPDGLQRELQSDVWPVPVLRPVRGLLRPPRPG